MGATRSRLRPKQARGRAPERRLRGTLLCLLAVRLSSGTGTVTGTQAIMIGPSLATDLPLKGQFFHREAENPLFRRPREEKKLNFK